METEKIIFDLIYSVVYVTLGVAMMFLSFFLLEKITSFSIKKELIEDENIAIGVMFAGFFVATGIIVGAAII